MSRHFDFAARSKDPRPGLLALSLSATLLAAAGWYAMSRFTEWRAAQSDYHAASELSEAARNAAARIEKLSPADKEALYLQRNLLSMLSRRWTGLFASVESAHAALKGEVALTAVRVEAADDDGQLISVAATASSAQKVLEFVQALAAQPGVSRVRLMEQHRAADAGNQTVSFTLAFVCMTTPAAGGLATAAAVTAIR